MITAGDFRNGMTFEEDGNVMQVVEFQHVKPGKGAAFVRTKTKNVITGAVVEKSYNPTAKFPTAFVERKDMEYTYAEEGLYHFMDSETYDQVPLAKAQVEDALQFLKENMVATIKFYKGEAFSVEPPNFVVLQVITCEPAVAGNTATNATKPATVETGYTLMVPMFVNEGDMIRIDTRTGEYMERAK
ncbi:MAG: elongation factor P [Ruminiclostridium sp.]|nr:elongation factor P [Ruminiclostridium sp.]